MLGVLTRVFAALLALNMIGALVLVHAPAGVFVENGGFELVLALAAGAAAIALMGPGRIAVHRFDPGTFADEVCASRISR